MEGNTAINKQTKRITFMELDRSLTIRKFGYLSGDQKIDSENIVGGIYAWTADKKHLLIGCQTWRKLPPNIWGRLFKRSLS